MLSMLFAAKRKRKKTLEEKVYLIQQGNQTLQNEVIKDYKPFIAKTVSSVCKRYIYETDDEFSIGLIAFNESIQKYSPDKGSSLISFSEVLIKRRVIDYIRKQAKYQHYSMDITQDSHDDEQTHSVFENDLSIEEYKQKTDEQLRKDEIMEFTELLKEFNLTFQDLIEQSPKHVDARQNAINIAVTLVGNEELKTSLLEKKRLPIKQLEKYVSVSRKTIERNRKYIIAIALILLGDFVFLKDYIKGVAEA